MELVKNRRVYCLGTKDGMGVREVLEEHGGIYTTRYDFNDKVALFYIHPANGYITYAREDSDEGKLVKALFTEVKPLEPKRWRAELGKPYYTIITRDGIFMPNMSNEDGYSMDDSRYNSGNYYRTKEECLKVANACNELIYGSIHSEE